LLLRLNGIFQAGESGPGCRGFRFPGLGAFSILTPMSPLMAIVGRPNVGKSAVFNRIAGRRIAIVHDQPGVTRDRISAEVEWQGRPFTLVDTGGISLLRGEKATDPIAAAALEQVRLAIESAHVILLVVDAQEGVTPLDRDVAARLRESGKPVLVVANKVDTAAFEPSTAEFSELGFDRIQAVSALHDRGFDPLLKTALALASFPGPAANDPTPTPPPEPPLRLAVVGRPNVGKSSLVNALTRSARVIVSPVPGTTRDSVDVPFDVETEGVRQSYVLIDTAGIRKERRVNDSIEFFSVKRAEAAIERCDIAVFILDAAAGILEQDKKIADKITAANKACILVVNKWDLFEATVTQARRAQRHRPRPNARGETPVPSLAAFGEWVQNTLFFLDYAPVIFASATTGTNLDRLLEAVRYVAAQLRQRIPTALLNRTLQAAVERRQPISRAGHFLRFFYATQTEQAPPTFLLFVNRDELFSDAYKKYLANQLRAAFGFEGCPIVLIPKPRPKTIPPVRRHEAPHRRRAGRLSRPPKRHRTNPAAS
jgi:GTP-binding protein